MEMNNTIQKVIASLQTKISGLNFNNWIKPATFRLGEDQKLHIEVPNKFIRDWISENYLDLIKYELFKVSGLEHEVSFRIVEEASSEELPTLRTIEVAPPPPANLK